MGLVEVFTDWNISSILLSIFLVLFMYYMYPLFFRRVTGLPRPPAIPLFGNFYPYIKNGVGFQDIANINKYGKVFSLLEARDETVVVADTEILKKVLVKEFSEFTNRRILYLRGALKWSLFHSTDATWRRLRHLLTPSFTSGKLKKMIPMMDTCIDRLVDNLNSKAMQSEKVEIKSFMGAFTMDVIASCAFGLEIDSQNDPNNPFIRNAKDLLDIKFTRPLILISLCCPLVVPFLDKLGFVLSSREPMDFYRQFLQKAIKERQENPKEYQDFLQLMLDAEKDDLDAEGKEDLQGIKVDEEDKYKGLSSNEVLAQALLFFLAGYDTISTTLSFLVYNLATNPECQEKVYREITEVMENYKEADYEAISKLVYLDQCIQETLRIFPPIVRVDRRARKDIDVNGSHVPAGIIIIVPIYALHHNPEIWPEPEKFDPERFTPEAKQSRSQFNYLPFGLGPRQCIGMRQALMEIKLTMVKMVQKFKFRDGDIPLDIDTSFLIKSKSGIWVYPELR